jgi:3-isopropylmalate/(R)-2-methylmalate dehydratase small subunit
VLNSGKVDQLFREVTETEGYRLGVNLEDQSVITSGGDSFFFDIDPFRKQCLLNGLDEIGLTLQHADKIKAFEGRHRVAQPWLFP